MDDYERALGLEPRETWLIKRLLRNYWQAGDDVFPSFKEIATQANITEPTLRKLRDGLIKKGLLKSTGKKGRTNGLPDNRNKLNLTPLFDALGIYILCDPASKFVKQENHKEVRREFSEYLGNDPDNYIAKQFENVDFPISLENAREIAKNRGVSLAWDVIARMQGTAAMEAAENEKDRYFRQLEIKHAVTEAADDLFGINWGYKRAYRLLQRLVDSNLTPDDLFDVMTNYARIVMMNGGHTFNMFESHVIWAIDRYAKTEVETVI